MNNNYYCRTCPYYYKGFDKFMGCEYNACECWGYEYYPDIYSCNKKEVEEHMANLGRREV